MPIITQAQLKDAEIPVNLSAQALSRMTFDALKYVAYRQEIPHEFIATFDRQELYDYLLAWLAFDSSPIPPLADLESEHTAEAGPYHLPYAERAPPPRNAKPPMNTRKHKQKRGDFVRDAVNRRSPQVTPEPQSDDEDLAEPQALQHAINLLREYRKGNLALMKEADEAAAGVDKLRKEIANAKQALLMQRLLRKRMEAYILYRRERADTWTHEQIFPDIPRFTQIRHGEVVEVDAVDADNDPHLKSLMEKNYSKNAFKMDKPLAGEDDEFSGDEEEAREENQVNKALSEIYDDRNVAPNPPTDNNQNHVVTTVAERMTLNAVLNINRSRRMLSLFPAQPMMDVKALQARLDRDFANKRILPFYDVQTWVDARRADVWWAENDADTEWDAYVDLCDAIERGYDAYRNNPFHYEEHLNADGEHFEPYELYWNDHCDEPWFNDKWALAMQGYERYCQFSRIIQQERAEAALAARAPVAPAPVPPNAQAGPSAQAAQSGFTAPKDPRLLKRTASQASLGRSNEAGPSNLPSHPSASERHTKQRKTGLSPEDVERIHRQNQQDEEATSYTPPTPPAWKGKGRMLSTPSPKPRRFSDDDSSGSDLDFSPGKFPASWLRPKPVDGDVRASLERRAASIESSRRSQSGSPSGPAPAPAAVSALGSSARKAPPGRTPTRSPSPNPDAKYFNAETPVGNEGERECRKPILGYIYDIDAEIITPSPAGPAPARIRRRLIEEMRLAEEAASAVGSVISKAKDSVTSFVRRMSGSSSSSGGESSGKEGRDEPSTPIPIAGPSRLFGPSPSAAGPSRTIRSPRRGGPYNVTARSRIVATVTSTSNESESAVAPPVAASATAAPTVTVASAPVPVLAPAAPAVAAPPPPIVPPAAITMLATPPGSPVERRLRSRVAKGKQRAV